MTPELRILIVKGLEPDPDAPGQMQLAIKVLPCWFIGNAKQECTAKDNAQVIALLKDALDAAIGAVDFEPPKIIRPAAVMPGAH